MTLRQSPKTCLKLRLKQSITKHRPFHSALFEITNYHSVTLRKLNWYLIFKGGALIYLTIYYSKTMRLGHYPHPSPLPKKEKKSKGAEYPFLFVALAARMPSSADYPHNHTPTQPLPLVNIFVESKLPTCIHTVLIRYRQTTEV